MSFLLLCLRNIPIGYVGPYIAEDILAIRPHMYTLQSHRYEILPWTRISHTWRVMLAPIWDAVAGSHGSGNVIDGIQELVFVISVST